MIKEGTSIAGHWEELDGRKGDLLERCEQYARWTIPSIFPEDKESDRDTPQESEKGNVAIGARLVNHLAHRIVDTMFPNDKPFFALALTPEAKKRMAEDKDPEVIETLSESLVEAENAAMRELQLTAYRPIAIQALSLKIVTGNALIYRMPDGTRVAYSVRDYCVVREISGKVKEVILRDAKFFGSLDESTRNQLVATGRAGKKYEDDTPVELYTYYYWKDRKWYMRQAVDEIEISSAATSYRKEAFPCLILAWNLARGDSYGRGLVEDYAVSFHNIDVMTAALIDLIGIAADIKFLVNDTSTFDVEAWNTARRGQYVAGKEGDITVPQFQFAVEVNLIAESIAKLERELAQAFLLSSAGVRDAERVTAEEIRFFAREIESAFGGLYSRLALDWQKREAEYLLVEIKLDTYINGVQAYEVQVTTGLESLSREGKLDALRLAIGDLQMLEVVPEELRAAINPRKFLKYIFRNRGVDTADEFLYTADEMSDNAARDQQQQEALLEKQGEVQVASKAAAS